MKLDAMCQILDALRPTLDAKAENLFFSAVEYSPQSATSFACASVSCASLPLAN